MVNRHYIQERLSPPTVWVYKPPLQDWLSQLHAQRWQVSCISKIWSYAYISDILISHMQTSYFAWRYNRGGTLRFFVLQKILWKVHHPKEEQVAVIMHEGISKSRVSASLLQGNTVPKTRSLFFQRRSSLNRLPVQAWSPAWPDGCGSSRAASTSVSLPSGWKSTVVQSIPINARKTASSWISNDGSISGA